jgi:hypothetical protein
MGGGTAKGKKTYPIILLFRVFVTIVTFLPSHCLATILGHTDRHSDLWEGPPRPSEHSIEYIPYSKVSD